MDSTLEEQRACYEEIDRLEKGIVDDLRGTGGVLRDNINREHRIAGYIGRIHTRSRHLKRILESNEGEAGREVAKFSKGDFSDFYSDLENVKTYHKYKHDVIEPLDLEFIKMEAKIKEGDVPDMAEFSDEEGNGRFIDLHDHFSNYINIKGLTDVPDYVHFLDIFDQPKELPVKLKRDATYKVYIGSLYNYLISFVKRASPLYDVENLINLSTMGFESNWKSGLITGWSDSKFCFQAQVDDDTPLPDDVAYVLSRYSAAEDLAMVGRDGLKDFCERVGLKTGGTAVDLAKRLRSIHQVPRSKWSKKIKATGVPKGNVSVAGLEDVAKMELVVADLAHILESIVEATKENVQRKQARTAEEMENDLDDEEIDADEDSDEEEEKAIYNPKNVPLGVDGKPIPYWLFKLHGLNQTYICQICGDFPYKGPRNFQRHFQESRHSQAMRALGIPNTIHFHGITQIEDAYALWKKLKADKAGHYWKPENEQEFEDSQGNVLTKKIHDDLKRQGLL